VVVAYLKALIQVFAVTYSGIPRSFVQEEDSTNSVEDRGQKERGSRGGSPLARDSAQIANE
jgi:hypothetical protein